jgi:hypothetical protein
LALDALRAGIRAGSLLGTGGVGMAAAFAMQTTKAATGTNKKSDKYMIPVLST